VLGREQASGEEEENDEAGKSKQEKDAGELSGLKEGMIDHIEGEPLQVASEGEPLLRDVAMQLEQGRDALIG